MPECWKYFNNLKESKVCKGVKKFLMSKRFIFLIAFLVFTRSGFKKNSFDNFHTFSNGLEISSFLNLVYVENRGKFWYVSQHDKSFYFILSMIVSAYIVYLINKSNNFVELIGLSLI